MKALYREIKRKIADDPAFAYWHPLLAVDPDTLDDGGRVDWVCEYKKSEMGECRTSSQLALERERDCRADAQLFYKG